ncbi:MAG: hypothetical protein H0V66_03420 [Bdellovibrionales bacterium]|nr:hypothetical protein [Bdellovibrionales bacterium]
MSYTIVIQYRLLFGWSSLKLRIFEEDGIKVGDVEQDCFMDPQSYGPPLIPKQSTEFNFGSNAGTLNSTVSYELQSKATKGCFH